MFNIFNKKVNKSVDKLSTEDKYLVEEMLDDGKKPKEISEETNLDYAAVYRHYQTWNKRIERARANGPYRNPQIDELKEQLQLEDLKHQLETKREKQTLELEKLKLDLEEKRFNLYGEEEESEEEELPGIMAFLTTLLDKNKVPGEQSPNINTLSPGVIPQANNQQELSEDTIKDLIEQTRQNNPEYITLAKLMPGKAAAYLKETYNFSDETIKKALEIIKEDGIKQ